MLSDKVQSLELQNEIIALFTDAERPDVFSAGIVKASNSCLTILSSITKDGLCDGLVVRPTEDIIKIEAGTQYLKALKTLWNYYSNPISDFEASIDFTLFDNYYDILNYARSKSAVICLWANGDDVNEICGFVDDVAQDYLKIRLISPFGEHDGIAIINLSEVKSINIEGIDEQRRLILSRIHRKLQEKE
jgi:hypothetical protein